MEAEVVLGVRVIVCPLAVRMSSKVAVMVSCDMAATVMSILKMQVKVGLDRPFFRLTNIPIQFCKPFARAVVRVGSVKIVGSCTGTPLMILFRLVLDIALLVVMMLRRIYFRETFAIGSK